MTCAFNYDYVLSDYDQQRIASDSFVSKCSYLYLNYIPLNINTQYLYILSEGLAFCSLTQVVTNAKIKASTKTLTI